MTIKLFIDQKVKQKKKKKRKIKGKIIIDFDVPPPLSFLLSLRLFAAFSKAFQKRN